MTNEAQAEQIDQTESSDETTPESSETIEDTKQELAKMYLNFLDKQKGGLLATGAGFGINLNPLQKDAIEYLTTEIPIKEKKNIFSRIGEKIKKKFIEKIFGGTVLEYNTIHINKMRALIDQHKNDQVKLQELMQEIESGKDPTAQEDIATKSDKKEEEIPSTTPPGTAEIAAGIVGTGVIATETYDKDKYKSPIKDNDAEITSKFGKRTDPVTGEKNKQHNGIDIAAPKKTPIHSVVSGKVIESQRDSKGGGNYISIQGDDGKIYSYLHLNKRSSRKVGDVVQAGDVIGEVGSTGKSTGPHLHLSVKENDILIDPLAALPKVFDDYKIVA